jgi:Ran GTPase-activating protein (RanGAP) involved in mRNA processing and transport
MTSPLVTGLVRCLDGSFDPKISSVVLSSEKFSSNLKLTDEDLTLLFGALVKNWTVNAIDLNKHAGAAVKFSLNEERPFLKILRSHPFKLLELRADGACMRKFDAFLLRDYLSLSGSLVRLDISGSSLRAVGASILCDGLKINKTLLHLGLSGNKLDSSSAKFLSEVLKIHPILFHLDLSNNLIGPIGAMHMATALVATTSLGHLNISGNVIGNIGITELCDALLINESLTLLDISSNRIDSWDAFVSLGNSLRGNGCIQKLNLSGNGLPSSCLDFFEDDEPEQFSFNFLDLSSVNISVSSLRKLSFLSLVQINLAGCNIDDDGASEISHVISTSITIKELSLFDNCITATGAAFLAKALQSNKKLERLSLSQNPLGDAGFKIICKCLESNRSLQCFQSECCELSDEATLFLKNMLASNSSIIELNLGNNSFTSHSAASNISIGLNSHRSLEMLDLHKCRISSGISQICNALKSNNVFKHLDVSGNMIDESSCLSISQFITSTQSLLFLDLSTNNLNNEGVAKIARALQTNKSLLYVGLNNNGFDETDSLLSALRANSTLQKVTVKDRGSFGTIFSDSRVCCELDISRGEKAFFSSTEPAMFQALTKTVSQFISSSVIAASYFIFEELKLLPQIFAQEDIKFFVHGLSKLFHDRGITYTELQSMSYSTFRSIIPNKLQINEDQFKLFQCRVQAASVTVISDQEISYGPVVHSFAKSILHCGRFRGMSVYIQLFQVETCFDKMLNVVQRLVTLKVSGYRNILNYIAIIQNGDKCVGLVIGRVVHSNQDLQKFQSMRSLILADQDQQRRQLNWMHMYYMCLGVAEGLHSLVCSPPLLPEGWRKGFDNERRACYFHMAGSDKNKTFSRPSVTQRAPILDVPITTSDSIFVDHQYCTQVSFLGEETLTQDVAVRTIRCILADVAFGCCWDCEELYTHLFSCDCLPDYMHVDQIPPEFLTLLRRCFPNSGPLPALSSIIDTLRLLSKQDTKSIPAKFPDFCREFVCIYFQWDDHLSHLSTEQLSCMCSRVGDVSFCRSICSDDFGNRGYVYFDRISTYNLDEIIQQCFDSDYRSEADYAEASFFLEPSTESNFTQDYTANAVEGRGTRMGHPGQWRNHTLQSGQKGYLRNYCSSELAEEGSLCRHGSESIQDSHWSCCGSKDFRSECTGHRGCIVLFGADCSSCRHQDNIMKSHWSCCGSDVSEAKCPASAKSMALKGVPKSDAMEPLIRLLPFGSNCFIFGSYALWLFEEARGSRPNWMPGDCDFFCLNVTTDELKEMAQNFCVRVKSNLKYDLKLSQINQNLISIDFCGSSIRVNETKISFVRSSFCTLVELQATIDLSVARVGVRIKPVNGDRNFIMPVRTRNDIEAGTMSWAMDPYMDTRSPQAQYFTEKLLPRLRKYMQRGYKFNRMETKLTAIDSFIFSYDEKEPSFDAEEAAEERDQSEGSNHWGGSDQGSNHDTSPAHSAQLYSDDGDGNEHEGTWRDQNDTQLYCSTFQHEDGLICTHSGGVIQANHWSCCGVTNRDAGCPGKGWVCCPRCKRIIKR